MANVLQILETIDGFYKTATGNTDTRIHKALTDAEPDMADPDTLDAVRYWLADKTKDTDAIIQLWQDTAHKTAELEAQERRDKAKAELQAELAQPEPDAAILSQAIKAYTAPDNRKADIGALTADTLDAFGASEGYPIDFWAGLQIPAPGCTLIGARTGGGKTSALVNVARNLLAQGKSVAFVSYEMSAQEIALALRLSMAADAAKRPVSGATYPHAIVPLFSFEPSGDDGTFDFVSSLKAHIRNHSTPAPLVPATEAVKQALRLGRLAILDGIGSADKLAEYITRTRFDAYLVDYAQAIPAAPDAAKEGYRRIGATVDLLRPLVNSGHKCLIMGAQFNRENKLDDKEQSFDPILEQFREAADLEQLATMAVGIGYYGDTSGASKRYFWKLLKHRFNGTVRDKRLWGEARPLCFRYYFMECKGTWEKSLWDTTPKAKSGTKGKTKGTSLTEAQAEASAELDVILKGFDNEKTRA